MPRCFILHFFLQNMQNLDFTLYETKFLPNFYLYPMKKSFFTKKSYMPEVLTKTITSFS